MPLFLLVFIGIFGQSLPAQSVLVPSSLRSFDDIFPEFPGTLHAKVFSRAGYFNTQPTGEEAGSNLLARQGRLKPGLVDPVLEIGPRVLVESMRVVSYPAGNVSLLDIYNAIGRIRDLGGRTYRSHSRGSETPLFEEATRLGGPRNNSPVGDPEPALELPLSQTIYMRLRDTNFGNTFYRAEVGHDGRSLHLTMSNNRNITVMLFPAIREGMFVARMYFEPIAEGVLMYSLAGVGVSDFVSSRIHMPSAIEKRLSVIMGWAADGIAGGQSSEED